MTAKETLKKMIQEFQLRACQENSAAGICFYTFWKPRRVKEPETEHGGEVHALKVGLEGLPATCPEFAATFPLTANVGLK